MPDLPTDPMISCKNVCVSYGPKQTLRGVSLDIARGSVTAFIGPSGCGKSTFLRCLNRMNDIIPNAKVTGEIVIGGENIMASSYDVIDLRRRVGMVFQKSNPFPKSIFENVAYGLRVNGVRDKDVIQQQVERSLQGAGLWNEVEDRLHSSALDLSGGQQQRLCIARAMAIEPDVILMDEPCSALDPIATQRIEDLIKELQGRYTIVIVTHNMQQAQRISDHTAFFYLGEMVEYGPTDQLWKSPKDDRTAAYTQGVFG